MDLRCAVQVHWYVLTTLSNLRQTACLRRCSRNYLFHSFPAGVAGIRAHRLRDSEYAAAEKNPSPSFRLMSASPQLLEQACPRAVPALAPFAGPGRGHV